MLLFSYAYRSLLARFRANLVSVLAVVLFVTGGSLGLSYYTSLKSVVTSVPDESVIVLSKGATGENDSKVKLDAAHKVEVLEGIRQVNGAPLASRELLSHVAVAEHQAGRFDAASAIRGIDERSLAVHNIKLIEGTPPAPRSLDIIVGKRLVHQYPHLRVGYELHLPGGPSKITGIFSAGGGPFEDELWTDHAALELHTKTATSTMHLVADSAGRVPALVDKINSSKDLELQAFKLSELGSEISGLKTIVKIVLVLLVLLTVVATSAIATTMNAAVVVRLPELAALAAIGIRKRALARIVLVESTLLGLVGGLLGVGASAFAIAQLGFITLGANPVEMSTSPVVLLIGLALGVVAGVLGGIAPSLQVKRLDILATLR